MDCWCSPATAGGTELSWCRSVELRDYNNDRGKVALKNRSLEELLTGGE